MAKFNSFGDLETRLTRDSLLDLAGDRSFQRGEEYVRQGYVQDLMIQDDDALSARVTGREDYFIDLWTEGDSLQSSCTCPLGMDGIFCKHCVAVGLFWLNSAKSANTQQGDRNSVQKPVTMRDVESFLERQEKEVLIEWILDRAANDPDWQQQLLLKVASQRREGLDVSTFQRALENAIEVDEFIPWGAVHDYANRINLVLESIQELVTREPDAVVELCEAAMVMLERAMNAIDDSSGYVGTILDDVQSLHYEACQLGSPDPIALACRLFDLYLYSDYGLLGGAVINYADVLGTEGVEAYRVRAEAMWQTFPDRTPQDKPDFNDQRNKVQRILESLAKQSGDVEAIVTIKCRDLSSTQTYLQIAQLYSHSGQADRALEWAEAGLKAFERLDGSLRDFIVEEYHRRDRGAEAMALIWQGFEQAIGLWNYKLLKTHTVRVNDWEVWREKALAHIRSVLAALAKSTGRQTMIVGTYGLARDRSVLVEIFLWEEEDSLAWQEAIDGGCSKHLWLKLADRRKLAHPTDALPIYQREVEPLIKQTNNTSYASAIEYLTTVRDLMIRLDRESEFQAWATQLEKTYKGKRNFVTLLRKQGW